MRTFKKAEGGSVYELREDGLLYQLTSDGKSYPSNDYVGQFQEPWLIRGPLDGIQHCRLIETTPPSVKRTFKNGDCTYELRESGLLYLLCTNGEYVRSTDYSGPFQESWLEEPMKLHRLIETTPGVVEASPKLDPIKYHLNMSAYHLRQALAYYKDSTNAPS